MRRRIISLLLCGIFLFSGCKRSVQEEEGNFEYERISMFCDVEFWGAPVWDVTEGSVTGDISKATGAVLDVIEPIEDAETQLSRMLITDDLPDLIVAANETVIGQLVTSDKVWKLDEFMQTYKPDSHLLTQFPEDIKYELEKRDGGWYAYPSHMSSPDNREYWQPSDYYLEEIEYYSDNGIIWNTNLLEQFGMKASDLQQESKIFEIFERVKGMTTEDGKEVIPLLVDGNNFQRYTIPFLSSTFGAENIDENGNYIDKILQPEMKDVLDFLNRSMRLGYMTPEQLLAENRVLCFIGNLGYSKISDDIWESSGVILSDRGSVPIYAQTLRRETGWMNTFVSKSCDNPELVAVFLDYMTSETGMCQWVFGKEGIHYALDASGDIVVNEKWMEDYENYKISGIGSWWMFFDSDWYRSVVADPVDASYKSSLFCAYARDEHTVCFDATAFQELDNIYAGDVTYEDIESELKKWKSEQIKHVILAETEEAFEEEYQVLIEGLKERQIEKLDQKKNEEYHKNCQEYDVYIQKVNQNEEKNIE